MKFEFKMGLVTESRLINNKKGNLFTVRIVPDMEEMNKDVLPLYPNFFKDHDYAYQADDAVWCLVNDDFTVGFILGLAQGPAGDNITSFIQLINVAEESAGFPKSGYDELSVLRFSGQSIQYYNVNTGGSGTIYNTKAVFLVSPNGGIWIKNTGFSMQISADGDFHLNGRGANLQEFAEEHSTINGNSSESIKGSKLIESDGMMKLDSSSSMDIISGSNLSVSTVGDKIETITGKMQSTLGQGSTTDVVAGSIKERILLGNYQLSVVAGNASLSVGLGTLSIYGGASVNISSTSAVNISAPMITIPATSAPLGGVGIPGMLGGFNAIPICPASGLPHSTNTLVAAVINTPPLDTLVP
jgi:hypothetical protein